MRTTLGALLLHRISERCSREARYVSLKTSLAQCTRCFLECRPPQVCYTYHFLNDCYGIFMSNSVLRLQVSSLECYHNVNKSADCRSLRLPLPRLRSCYLDHQIIPLALADTKCARQSWPSPPERCSSAQSRLRHFPCSKRQRG